jgi:hypothetical protein
MNNLTPIRNASIKEAAHALRNDLLGGDIAAEADTPLIRNVSRRPNHGGGKLTPNGLYHLIGGMRRR